MRVSFIPQMDEFRSNALFEGRREGASSHSPNAHWFDCYVALGELAREAGITMATLDVLPVESADVAVFMSQPSPVDIAAFRARHPRLKTVLIQLETSLGAGYSFNPANHADFDVVLTYRENLIDGKKYFRLRPRAYFLDRRKDGAPFSSRRTACLVGTNRKMRYRSGLMLRRSGWRLSLRERIDYMFCPGELITYRTQVGRACVLHPAGDFDVLGEGWELDGVTRGRTLPPPQTSTLSYIGNYKFYFAFENHAGSNGLISERIWDALWGGAVPVYRGSSSILQVAPRSCYVDARAFGSPSEMLDALHRMPEEEWVAYRAAAVEFLEGDGVKPWLPDVCGREMLEPFLALKRDLSQSANIARAAARREQWDRRVIS